ncbi:MAG: hypothetical protein BAJALOKI2v1_800014 [Promethearchaeota archaeon]|nr:MAG: hypothetical protein BAJALOKI2v1_800014 [Candidatus Lokiarchaeota archaeon]
MKRKILEIFYKKIAQNFNSNFISSVDDQFFYGKIYTINLIIYGFKNNLEVQ